MSNTYNLEPHPTAKLILKTTSGDLSLELFAKQIPLASRNFLQHCLDGYYNNTIFHRLVPGFIIQGGDPTGTGSGGISAINDGEPFQDEFHSRLKFNRRGLLGMANEGKDNNGSQFFFTLGAGPEVQALQGRHTMFGRIEGDTIYNLMKMAEAELAEGESSERPLYPTRITGVEVLVNPFEDVVARVKEAPRMKEDDGRRDVKKRKKPSGKNVLSFGGEDGDEEMAPPVLKKSKKANPKFVAASIEVSEEVTNTTLPEVPNMEKKVAKMPKRKSQSPDLDSPFLGLPHREVGREMSSPNDAHSPSPEPEFKKSTSALEKTNAEIAALKASMKRSADVAPTLKEKPKSSLEALIPATSTRGRKRGKLADEKGALDLFKQFKQRLEDIPDNAVSSHESDDPLANGTRDPAPVTTGVAEEDEEAGLCDLHFIANCQSCKSWDAHDGAESDGDDEREGQWMAHRLTFAKDTLGKDLEWKRKMDEIELIDPREKARAIKEERKKGKEKRM